MSGGLSFLYALFLTPLMVSAQISPNWLPGDCNAILVIDVAAAYKSPVAQQNQWAKKAAESFISQEVFLPPSAQRLMVGARLDLPQGMALAQQTVVLDLRKGMDLSALTGVLGGSLETFDKFSGLRLSGDRYVVQMQSGPFLMVNPGGRQATLRMARAGEPAKPSLSPFLLKAANALSADNPIVVAIDLEDVVTPAEVTPLVTDVFGAKGTPATISAAAQTLASVRGVTAVVELGQTRRLYGRVEFDRSPAPLVPHALPLLEAVLNSIGGSLDDSTGWKVRSESQALVYEGELSGTGLRRLISLVQPRLTSGSAETATTGTAEPPVVVASRRYYRAVRQQVDDLKTDLKKAERSNYALWYERAARTIDDLPLKDVDEELQTFAARVSNSLRYQGQAERFKNVRTGTRQAQMNAANSGWYVRPYGEDSQRAAIKAEGTEAATNVRFSEAKQIEDGFVQLRQSLTKRYNAEF